DPPVERPTSPAGRDEPALVDRGARRGAHVAEHRPRTPGAVHGVATGHEVRAARIELGLEPVGTGRLTRPPRAGPARSVPGRRRAHHAPPRPGIARRWRRPSGPR